MSDLNWLMLLNGACVAFNGWVLGMWTEEMMRRGRLSFPHHVGLAIILIVWCLYDIAKG